MSRQPPNSYTTYATKQDIAHLKELIYRLKGGSGSSSIIVPSVNKFTFAPVQTAEHAASAWEYVPCDISGGSFLVALPETPADNTWIVVSVIKSATGNALYVYAEGSDSVQTSGTTSLALYGVNAGAALVYDRGSATWYLLGTEATSSGSGTGPFVSEITPNLSALAGGGTITISGNGFTGATAVTFGSTPATSFVVVSGSEITAVAPALSAGFYDITVTTPAGVSGLVTQDAIYYEGSPTVTGIAPPTGLTLGGSAVQITGTNLYGATAVAFGGTAALDFDVVSPTEILAYTPLGSPGVVDITVTTPIGTSTTSAPDHYDYVLAGSSGGASTGWFALSSPYASATPNEMTSLVSVDGKDWKYVGTPAYTDSVNNTVWLYGPDVIRVGGQFFAVYLNSGRTPVPAYVDKGHLKILSSFDLVNWTPVTTISTSSADSTVVAEATAWSSSPTYTAGTVVSNGGDTFVNLTGSTIHGGSGPTPGSPGSWGYNSYCSVSGAHFFVHGGNIYIVACMEFSTMWVFAATDLTGLTTWDGGTEVIPITSSGFPQWKYDFTAPVFDGTTWHVWFVNWTSASAGSAIWHATSSSPLSGYTVVQNNLFAGGPGADYEAPAVYNDTSVGTYRMFCDLLGTGPVAWAESGDLTNWSSPAGAGLMTPVTVNGNVPTLATPMVRHGSFIPFGVVGCQSYDAYTAAIIEELLGESTASDQLFQWAFCGSLGVNLPTGV